MTAPEQMPPRTHDLKVWPEYFNALLSGEKTFEFRKDDREPRFAVGDILVLHEYVPPYRAETEHEWAKRFAGDYTGREVSKRVRYIARSSPLIPDGFCCMSLAEVESASLSVPPGEDVTTPEKGRFIVSTYHGPVGGNTEKGVIVRLCYDDVVEVWPEKGPVARLSLSSAQALAYSLLDFAIEPYVGDIARRAIEAKLAAAHSSSSVPCEMPDEDTSAGEIVVDADEWRETKRNAARWRYCLENAGWYRSDDRGRNDYMKIPVAKGADLSCVAFRQEAIDHARSQHSTSETEER